jgi:beta-lactamase class D
VDHSKLNQLFDYAGGILILMVLSAAPSAFALTDAEFKNEFGPRDGCFLVTNLKSGEVVSEFNSKRCEERFSPCSSFKIAAALMAFEKGVLKDENQIIKWDGIKRERPELNRDQTPYTWMSNSAKWVTEWITPQLGLETIQQFLNDFQYGNKDFSGGLKDAWQTTSLKISAREQSAFLTKLWKGELSISKRAIDLTKKITFIKKIGKASELYGKTGTGCLVGHACMEHPDKMIGWFVGILKTRNNDYVFAGNASDLIPQGPPAGPRIRETTVRLLEKAGLVD